MKLGELIDTLERMPSDAPVLMSNGRMPHHFDSWRGSYDELTLVEAYNRGDARRTVAEILQEAREADGGTFEGYKGGQYVMDRETPVWADPYGDCFCDAITGAVLSGDSVVLQVTNIGEYR